MKRCRSLTRKLGFGRGSALAKLTLAGGPLGQPLVVVTGGIVTVGSASTMTVRLPNPRQPLAPPAGSAKRQEIPRHILSITVGEREVQLRHEKKATRSHAVFVKVDGESQSVTVDYDCVLSIHSRGRVVIRDSPGAPRRGCWPDFTLFYSVAGVRADTGSVARRAYDADSGTTEALTREGHDAEFELQSHEIDYVTALSLPWLTKNPALWMTVQEINKMWSLGDNTINEAMRKLRMRMANASPPLWDPVHDDRAGANVAAATVLAEKGLVTIEDVTRLNILGYLERNDPPQRSSNRRSRRST